VSTLLNHFDILPTLAEITTIDISDIVGMDGQSFLPFLTSENYKGEDRYRFYHGGRSPLNPENVGNEEVDKKWIGTMETSDPLNSKFKNVAVRNERYRYVNDKELYDVMKDPGETTNIISENPDIVKQMQLVYDEWGTNIQPFLVNEKAPLSSDKPFWSAYEKQKEFTGIKNWVVSNLD
jgi:arylsulfatase A-like enzyme